MSQMTRIQEPAQGRDRPLFTVIMPAHNSRRTIKAAISSVLEQTEGNLELIVVDDGSKDDTAQIVQQIQDPRVHYVYTQNRGVSAARNLGIHRAQGELITFLDSDDEAYPGWLATLGALLEPGTVGVACCGMDAVTPGRSTRPTLPTDQSRGHLFLAGCYAARRSVIIRAGGFDDRLKYSENTDLGLRLIRECEAMELTLVASDQALIRSHRPDFSRSTNADRLEHHVAAVRVMMDKHQEMFNRQPSVAARYLAVAGVAAARLGRLSEARQFFGQAIRRYPRRVSNYARAAATLSPWLARRVWRTPNTTRPHT